MTTDPAAAALDKLRAAVAAIGPDGRPSRPADTTDTGPDPHDIARGIALRQLNAAPRTRAQLETALAKRGCDAAVAASVLDRFEEVGLIDDEAYAQMFVRSKQVGRGLATRALAYELRAKGVPDDVAEQVLDDVDPDEERRRAHEIVAKRLPRMHGLDPQVQARRLAGVLARKGYGGDVAYAVIRDAIADAAEHRRD